MISKAEIRSTITHFLFKSIEMKWKYKNFINIKNVRTHHQTVPATIQMVITQIFLKQLNIRQISC